MTRHPGSASGVQSQAVLLVACVVHRVPLPVAGSFKLLPLISTCLHVCLIVNFKFNRLNLAVTSTSPCRTTASADASLG